MRFYIFANKGNIVGQSCLCINLSACSFSSTIEPIWSKFLGVVPWIGVPESVISPFKKTLLTIVTSSTDSTVLQMFDSCLRLPFIVH